MQFNPIPLNLPPCILKLTENQGKIYVFDEIRKKNLVLTPEEWVRQHFIQFLIQEKQFPKGLIGVENGLKIFDKNKRSDILVLDTAGNPLLMVECKAPDIKLSQQTMDQLVQYNMARNCPWLIITNGLQHIHIQVIAKNKIQFLEELPNFGAL